VDTNKLKTAYKPTLHLEFNFWQLMKVVEHNKHDGHRKKSSFNITIRKMKRKIQLMCKQDIRKCIQNWGT